MSFPVFFFFCLLLSSYRVFCPGLFTPKSTLTQLKIHFVWPKSEGVCTMGLLHTALKLVLWRRMGYYYLPATHPAIKTSGATSPQRSAAALPSSHSLALVLHEPHTTERLALNSTSATLLQRQTQDSHSTLLCFTSRLWIFLPGCFFFFFRFFFSFSEWAFEPGVWSVWMDWRAKRAAAFCQLGRAMLGGQVRSSRASWWSGNTETREAHRAAEGKVGDGCRELRNAGERIRTCAPFRGCQTCGAWVCVCAHVF